MYARLLLATLAAVLLMGAGGAQAAAPSYVSHTPAALRAAAAAPRPTVTPLPQARASAPVRLVIPAIDLDRPLVSVGLDKNRIPIVPKHDIGWYNLSAMPGQGENVVFWGHVLRFKAAPTIPAPFARLKELEVGAKLTVYTADNKAHPYVVIEKVWARPDEVKYILPRGRELVTMVSCIGDKVIVGAGVEMTHRLITVAAPAK